MFDNILNETARGLDPFLDLGRVIIHHMGLYNPVYVPLRPLKDLSGKRVMENLQNVLNSHENLSLDKSFFLNVGFIKVPKGGIAGKHINKVGSSNDSLRIKRSCIKIQNTDELCLARSICMGFLKLHQIPTSEWQKLVHQSDKGRIEEKVMELQKCPIWFYKELMKHNKKNNERQKKLAILLCQKANVSSERRLSIQDIHAFEIVLNVDILVVSFTTGNKFIRTAPKDVSEDEQGLEIPKKYRIF